MSHRSQPESESFLKHSNILCLGHCEATGCSYFGSFLTLNVLHMNSPDIKLESLRMTSCYFGKTCFYSIKQDKALQHLKKIAESFTEVCRYMDRNRADT